MRPLKLRAEGFTSFREPVDVDFTDVDLAGIVGPTGSGKSSILDALTFALYGSAARLGQKAVSPAITLGCQEAKLSLDFEVAGEKYTATRVVRRTASGASSKEVRLEHGDQVMAGNVDEMNEHVEKLLGLDFEQFTKTVVLPQGEFATFLNDTPAGKQELLRRLLGMEVYVELGKRAADKAKELEAKVQVIDSMLEAQAVPTNQEVKAKKKQVAVIANLIEKLEPLVAAASQYANELKQAKEDIERRSESIAQLESLEIPGDATDLGNRLAHAREAQAKAQAKLGETDKALDEARKAVEIGPDARALEVVLENFAERENAAAGLQGLRVAADKARRELEEATEGAGKAKDLVDHARQHLLEAERLSGASVFIDALQLGGICPICDQKVTNLPSHKPDQELARAKKEVQDAENKYDAGEDLRRKIEKQSTEAGAKLDAADRLVDSLDKKIADAPPIADAESGIAKAAELEALLSELVEARSEKAAQNKQAGELVETLIEEERNLRKSFGQQRDELAALSLNPPEAELESLATDWDELATWGQNKLIELNKEYKASEKKLEKAKEKHDKANDNVEKLLADDGESLVPEPVAHFRTKLAVAEAELLNMESDRERFEVARTEVESLRTNQRVHEQLRSHLKATGFEQWLMEEAIGDLVDRATERLLELSGGQYSLTAEKTTFKIIDHRHADEMRDASTLSGGETFLASLALALALSDNLAEMASDGAPALEAIFLDEGFGTLDPDTLDIVATAMEELGASGRMVTIITHIRDLAERMPVRFEVAKGASTSTVERVEV